MFLHFDSFCHFFGQVICSVLLRCVLQKGSAEVPTDFTGKLICHLHTCKTLSPTSCYFALGSFRARAAGEKSGLSRPGSSFVLARTAELTRYRAASESASAAPHSHRVASAALRASRQEGGGGGEEKRRRRKGGGVAIQSITSAVTADMETAALRDSFNPVPPAAT